MTRSLGALLLTLIAGLLLMAEPVDAHLLNMSKARISLEAAGTVEVELALDLLLTAGSRERYFDLSRSDDALEQAAVRALLEPLPAAVDLRIGATAIPLEIVAVQFPKDPREVFLDPLRWPRTTITLRGALPALSEPLLSSAMQVIYRESFRFEEPIANTIALQSTGRSQTRWLVTGQRSPAFDASAWYLAATSDTVTLPPATAPEMDWRGLGDFLEAGFDHILPEGVDHLLFVAGLCLGAASLGSLVAIISLFTLAHSLTLCAMALGWVAAPSAYVEPLILLSIVWVALANLRKHSHAALRGAWVLLFGLLHGLGFASALGELGLPSQQVIPSLLAFNLGVEFGQLVFIAALTALLWLLRIPRLPSSLQTRQLGSALIGTMALGLLLARLG